MSGILVAANDTGDTGNLSLTSSCPSFIGVGQEYITGSYLNFKGCEVGTAKIGLYKGETLVKSYTVTVTSAVPMASGTPAGQSVNAGASTTVDVSGDFAGDVNRYSASSSDTSKASVSMNGSMLTINGVLATSTPVTVTVTATNNTNAIGTATQDYSVTVTATTTPPTAGGPTIPAGGPSVNAGRDQTVSTGGTVSLIGTGSPVNDDDDVSYSWTQQDTTTVNLTYSTGIPYSSGLAGNSARFTAPSTAGTLVFRLTVTDHGTGISSWDEVTITVS